MPLTDVVLTDTFDQWRQKTNAVIDEVNTLSSAASVVQSTSPSAGQLLLFNGSSYVNKTLSGAITVDATGNTTLANSIGIPKGRIRFAASLRILY